MWTEPTVIKMVPAGRAPVRGAAALSRRGVLAGLLGGGALAASAGCSWFGGGQPSTTPSPHVLAPVLAGTQDMVALYQATSTAVPSLADRVGPLLAEHTAHLAALRSAMGLPSAPPSASPSPSGAVPADPGTALTALRTAEQKAHDSAVAACLSAPSTYASLIGSIAACRATHVEALA